VAAESEDKLAEQLRELRREYLADSAQRVDELRHLYARLASGERAAVPGIRQAFHRLAGSGGSYGFPVVSTQSREGERLAVRLEGPDLPVDAADLEALRACVEAVAHAFAEALNALNTESLG
jgi:chemotaxis protein histidine kinase CheA